MNPGSMVVAVCCGRLHDLEGCWEHNVAQLDGDTFSVLLDGPHSPAAQELAARIRALGGVVLFHGEERGLAAARNSVLDAWPASNVLFIDDDVVLDDVRVVHDVDAGRFTLHYLLRRAYWQGRSEVRRGQPVAGLRKEWNRYIAPRDADSPDVHHCLHCGRGVRDQLSDPGSAP